MKTRIIGIAGLARSGKTTAARYLVEHYGYSELSFAAPIKRGLQSMFSLPEYYLSHKEEMIPWVGASSRQLLQTLGTEWGRALVGEDVWIRQVIRSIDASQGDSDHFIISDVRFPNEATWLRSVGTLLHIQRDNDVTVRAHASENGIAPLDGEIVIYNNGSLADLTHQLDCVMTGLRPQETA